MSAARDASYHAKARGSISAARARAPSTLQGLPWIWLPAGIVIALIVLAVNFVGDGLRDALDPRAPTRLQR